MSIRNAITLSCHKGVPFNRGGGNMTIWNDATGAPLASLTFYAEAGDTEREAVIRAVNTRDDLVAACKAAFDIMREADFVPGHIEDAYDAAMRGCVAALAKAGAA